MLSGNGILYFIPQWTRGISAGTGKISSKNVKNHMVENPLLSCAEEEDVTYRKCAEAADADVCNKNSLLHCADQQAEILCSLPGLEIQLPPLITTPISNITGKGLCDEVNYRASKPSPINQLS